MTKEVRGRRRGRPALADGEARDCTISVRLTPAERAALAEEAEAAGQGDRLGRHLYDRAMRRPAPRIPAVNLEAWGRLGKVAGGLTTMAKAAAAGHLDTIDRLLIEEVRDELRAVRLALIGADAAADDDSVPREPRRNPRRRVQTEAKIDAGGGNADD